MGISFAKKMGLFLEGTQLLECLIRHQLQFHGVLAQLTGRQISGKSQASQPQAVARENVKQDMPSTESMGFPEAQSIFFKVGLWT